MLMMIKRLNPAQKRLSIFLCFLFSSIEDVLRTGHYIRKEGTRKLCSL
jgi:hypothetical protein